MSTAHDEFILLYYAFRIQDISCSFKPKNVSQLAALIESMDAGLRSRCLSEEGAARTVYRALLTVRSQWILS